MPSGPEFVGRTQELADLASLLRRTDAGRGGVAVVVGEAGIGKTSLVEQALVDSGLTALWAHGREGAPPLSMWDQLVRAGSAARGARRNHRFCRRRATCRAGADRYRLRPLPAVRRDEPTVARSGRAPAVRDRARRPALGRPRLAGVARVPDPGARRRPAGRGRDDSPGGARPAAARRTHDRAGGSRLRRSGAADGQPRRDLAATGARRRGDPVHRRQSVLRRRDRPAAAGGRSCRRRLAVGRRAAAGRALGARPALRPAAAELARRAHGRGRARAGDRRHGLGGDSRRRARRGLRAAPAVREGGTVGRYRAGPVGLHPRPRPRSGARRTRPRRAATPAPARGGGDRVAQRRPRGGRDRQPSRCRRRCRGGGAVGGRAPATGRSRQRCTARRRSGTHGRAPRRHRRGRSSSSPTRWRGQA